MFVCVVFSYVYICCFSRHSKPTGALCWLRFFLHSGVVPRINVSKRFHVSVSAKKRPRCFLTGERFVMVGSPSASYCLLGFFPCIRPLLRHLLFSSRFSFGPICVILAPPLCCCQPSLHTLLPYVSIYTPLIPPRKTLEKPVPN